MKSNIFNDDFIQIRTALNEAGVSYILVGGIYSVILYEYHRTTGVLDDIENLEKVESWVIKNVTQFNKNWNLSLQNIL